MLQSLIVDGLLAANWSASRRGARAAAATAANTQALFDALPDEAKQRAYEIQRQREQEARRRRIRCFVIFVIGFLMLGGLSKLPQNSNSGLTAEKAIAIELAKTGIR